MVFKKGKKKLHIERLHRKVWSFILVLSMVFTMNVSTVLAVNSLKTNYNTSIDLKTSWADKDNNESTSLDLHPTSNEEYSITQKVTYTAEQIEQDYDVGDLTIVVKGLKNLYRDGTLRADKVAADEASNPTKSRAWSYSYNEASDEYTFTNNNKVDKGTNVNGFFTLVYLVSPEKTKHGFEQKGSAMLYYPDGTYNKTNELNIRNQTDRNQYTVNVEKGLSLSNTGLNGYIDEDHQSEYILLNYLFSYTETEKGRGLEDYQYRVTLPEGAIICNNSLKAKQLSGDTYTVELASRANPENNYMYVAIPKTYLGQEINVNLTLYGNYYEENNTSDNLAVIASKDFKRQLPADFSYDIPDGETYNLAISAADSQNLVSTQLQTDKGINNGYKVKTSYYKRAIQGEGENKKTVEIDAPVDLETLIDYNFISIGNGQSRLLKESEYNIRYIETNETLNDAKQQVTSGKYEVIASTSMNFNEGTKTSVQTGDLKDLHGINGTSKVINMPEGTKSVKIIYKNVEERFESQFRVSTNIHNVGNDILFNGGFLTRSANTRFFVLENGVRKESTTPIKLNAPGVDVEALDQRNYGLIPSRVAGHASLTEGTNTMQSNATFDTIRESGNSIISSGKLSASFNFTDSVHSPTKFSMYTVLPEGMDLTNVNSVNDVFDNVALVSGNGVVSQEVLTQHCTPELIKDYKGSGRTYLALHFDFNEGDLPPSVSIVARFNMTLGMEALGISGYNGSLQSYVHYDDDNTKISSSGLRKDDGNGPGGDIYADINQDQSTDDLVAVNHREQSFTYAQSGELSLKKTVKGSQDSSYNQKTSTEIGKDYTYAIELNNGTTQLNKVSFKEDLEALGDIKGTYKSISFSKGYTGSYDVDKKLITINEPVGIGQRLKVFIKMTLPSSKDNIGKLLKNQVTLDGEYSNGSKIELDSNSTEVEVTGKKGTISVKKVDSTSQEALSGAKFSIYKTDSNGNKTGDPISTKTTNGKGYANFKNLDYGDTYIIKEISAPKGYTLSNEEKKVTLDEDIKEFTVKDTRVEGNIKIIKSSSFNSNARVAGAKYQLSKVEADGSKTTKGIYTTDDKGEINFDNFEWGNYELLETEAPQGYQLDTQTHSFTVDRNAVVNDNNSPTTIKVMLEDQQEDTLVTLTKKIKTVKGVETNDVLQGAKFKLYKVNDKNNYNLDDEKTSQLLGEYITNEEGQIKVNQLAFGSYVFTESISPSGYNKCDDITFDLTPTHKEESLTAYDQQREGYIILQKSDGKGHVVKGAKFTLYDENMNAISGFENVEVNDEGKLTFNGLEWGTYHVKETQAPQGYQLDGNTYDVVIGAGNLRVILDVANHQVPGKIKIIKVNKDDDRLAGAEFNLCKNDGTVVTTLTTDTNGEATYDNIPWGSYYLEETVAPDGYTIDRTKRRFVVNNETAGITQTMKVVNNTDSSNYNSIKITKVINPEDTYDDHGELVFTFKVQYQQYSSWNTRITRNVTMKFDKNERSKSIVVGNIPSTKKQVRVLEYKTNRYSISEVKGNNVTLNKNAEGSYTFNLQEYSENEITFYNKKTNWKDYSDSGVVINTISKSAQVTSIKATYKHEGENVEARSKINKDDISVKAYYDDGTAKVLTSDEFTLDHGYWPNTSGPCMATVSYQGYEDTITANVSEQSVKSDDLYLANSIEKLNGLSPKSANQIIFTCDQAPVNKNVINVEQKDESFNVNTLTNGIVAWMDNNVLYISTQDPTKGIKLRPEAKGEFENLTSLISIQDDVGLNTSEVQDMSDMFNGCIALKSVDVSKWNTSKVTNMSSMFEGCSKLKDVDISKWNTSKVTNMSKMFNRCSALNSVDVINWKTSELLDVSDMFSGCTSLIMFDASSWQTPKLENMSSMFEGCVKLTIVNLSQSQISNVTNLSNIFTNCNKLSQLVIPDNWDTSKVTNMSNMFNNCQELQTLNVSNWNTSNVTDMNKMFNGCNLVKTLDVSKWNTSKVTNMSNMFNGCNNVETLDVSKWDISKVTNMSNMLNGCNNVETVDVSKWDTSSVTDMSNMFSNCESVEILDVSKWNTSKVTNMSNMFSNCESVETLDVSKWDTSKVTNMSNMFSNCESVETLDVSKWNTSNVTDMTYMFIGCIKLKNIDVSNLVTSTVTNIHHMFARCSSIETLDVSNWNTSNVKDMKYLIYYCESLKNIDLTQLDTSKVTDMTAMFMHCTSLQNLNITNFDTGNVTNMSSMFVECPALESLDLSSFNTSKVTSMRTMFKSDTSLKTILVGNEWNVDKVTSSGQMFTDCTSIVGQSGTTYDASKTDKTMANYATGYLTYKVASQSNQKSIKAVVNHAMGLFKPITSNEEHTSWFYDYKDR